MPRGFGPMIGPMHGRRGFGWGGWWGGLGIFGILFLMARFALLLLPLLLFGAIIYALLRR
ncbi:hypothetical protein [Thermococcus peptonophilus]|uniref:hypothetical protein n=1 Tax=Thermococcus peptonophilus TaxID=53952 RepID=UPI0006D1D777